MREKGNERKGAEAVSWVWRFARVTKGWGYYTRVNVHPRVSTGSAIALCPH